MNTQLIKTIQAIVFCSAILLTGFQAHAFSPTESAVNVCVDALEQKFGIHEQELELGQVRAKPVGVNSAVIYLHTIAKPEFEQPRERVYCRVELDGSVTRLRFGK